MLKIAVGLLIGCADSARFPDCVEGHKSGFPGTMGDPNR